MLTEFLLYAVVILLVMGCVLLLNGVFLGPRYLDSPGFNRRDKPYYMLRAIGGVMVITGASLALVAVSL